VRANLLVFCARIALPALLPALLASRSSAMRSLTRGSHRFRETARDRTLFLIPGIQHKHLT
jgi:hypothetical protein